MARRKSSVISRTAVVKKQREKKGLNIHEIIARQRRQEERANKNDRSIENLNTLKRKLQEPKIWKLITRKEKEKWNRIIRNVDYVKGTHIENELKFLKDVYKRIKGIK